MTMLATCSTGCASLTPTFRARSTSSKQQPIPCRRQTLVTRAVSSDETHQVVSRRAVSLTGLGALLLSLGGPAQALPGLPGATDKNEVYTTDTANLLEKVKNGLDLPKDASNRQEVFQEIKDKTTAWVAKYRRGGVYQGRPSYSVTYSAVNALAGHFNSFGLTAPVPKKRLERIQKEISDADRALKRGR